LLNYTYYWIPLGNLCLFFEPIINPIVEIPLLPRTKGGVPPCDPCSKFMWDYHISIEKNIAILIDSR